MVEAFMESLQDLKPTVNSNGLELLKYSQACKD